MTQTAKAIKMPPLPCDRLHENACTVCHQPVTRRGTYIHKPRIIFHSGKCADVYETYSMDWTKGEDGKPRPWKTARPFVDGRLCPQCTPPAAPRPAEAD